MHGLYACYSTTRRRYDCDFNMALEIESPHRSIFDIDSLSTMADTPIGLGNRLCAKLRLASLRP